GQKVGGECGSQEGRVGGGRAWGDMSTGGSRAVRTSQEFLRKAGATAREMLIAAAAARWDVPAQECAADRGVITHGESGRTLRFGEVAEAAAALPPPATVSLKRPAEWTLIGTPQKRLDVAAKVTARPPYAIDAPP